MDQTARQPNLLFILTDEQRHDTLAAYGNRAIKTPHLNRLADEAVVFTPWSFRKFIGVH